MLRFRRQTTTWSSTPAKNPGSSVGLVSMDATKWVFLFAHLLPAAPSRPNLLFFVADDLRAELGALGDAHVYTPEIDAVAQEALVLGANHVQIAVCGPTRASFLTGRRPETLRTVTHTSPTYWRERMGAGNFSTLPQMLRESGWHTLSFGKVFDLRTSTPKNDPEGLCDAKFSWSEPPALCGTAPWSEDTRLAGCPPACPAKAYGVLSPESEAKSADNTIVAAALERLNGLPSPWMVAVGVHRPHLPQWCALFVISWRCPPVRVHLSRPRVILLRGF
jgi:iduronate 2-sulfatase